MEPRVSAPGTDPSEAPDDAARPPRRNRAFVLYGLLALFFCLRLPGLRDLPIFCDEAIYLRYAQLVLQDPVRNAFVSLVDPKPPLHYWLLASVFRLTRDPLLAGRLLSVLAGAAALPVLLLLSLELKGMRRRSPGGSLTGAGGWTGAV
ncbi:MAG TPA: hypothetical protein VLO07_05430, partial [Thermoanaerobaculia bacterium]|nr:hypothetical protein [Thermoanaerobaculia bacterium]